jgi:hypothetical protein
MKEYPTCAECGSLNVVKDAYAEWDHEGQQWVLHAEYDQTVCKECEGETMIKWMNGDPKEEDDAEVLCSG